MPEQIMQQYARIQNAYEKVVKRLIEEKRGQKKKKSIQEIVGDVIYMFFQRMDH